MDPNSEEARWLRATEGERRANLEARIRKDQEESRRPAIAYEIDEALYAKAETRNAELSDEERALLLRRGDVMGKGAGPSGVADDRGNVQGIV